MKTNKSTSEGEILENYKASFNMVESRETIQDQLSNYGYTAEHIAEGQVLLNEAVKLMRAKEDKYFKCFEAHLAFKSLYDELCESYNHHRGIAKIVFRRDDISQQKLALKGSKPQTYEKSMEGIITFYAVATSESDIQSELARLRLTPEKLESTKDLISSVEVAKKHYISEKSNAQKATKIKNIALSELAEWMKDFYAVAKMAVEEYSMLL
jgi:hypothetical protein